MLCLKKETILSTHKYWQKLSIYLPAKEASIHLKRKKYRLHFLTTVQVEIDNI